MMEEPTTPTARSTLALAAVAALALASCGGSGHKALAAATVPPSIAASTSSTAASTTTATTAPPATAAPATTAPPATPAPTTAAPTTRPACAPSIASSLATTGGASQLIVVEASSYATTYATLSLWQRSGACWVEAAGPWGARIGAAGFSDHHREGDNTTPAGAYGIGPTMYGNAPNPGVHYAYHQLVCGDWWDEDPSSPGYNTFQHVGCGQQPPFGGGSEALWTETAAYPSFALVDYNTGPIVAGAGSAIFIHADTGSPTAGCVSVPLSELDHLLDWLNPADGPLIVMGPASEITRF